MPAGLRSLCRAAKRCDELAPFAHRQTARAERRHQTIRLRDRHWNPRSVVRRRRPSPYERNAAISRHFEREPIPYALETDWPVEAAGFEPLHLRSEFTKTLSLGDRTRTCGVSDRRCARTSLLEHFPLMLIHSLRVERN